MTEQKFQKYFQREIFSGTTVENFRTVTIIKEKKIIYRKDPSVPGFAGTYFDMGGLEYPIKTALARAIELTHTPLVFSVHLWKWSRYLRENPFNYWLWLPYKTTLPVSRLWIPNGNEWKNLPLQKTSEEERAALFHEISPREFIKHHS